VQIGVVIPNHNGAEHVLRTVASLLRQSVPAGTAVNIVVVDDGSTDGSPDRLRGAFDGRIEVLELPTNQGRSTARNAGAGRAVADLLVFVDSDCVPADDAFVSEHLAAIERGAEVSFGQVCTPGHGFWDRMQRETNEARRRAAARGEAWMSTTANVAITRKAFDAVGGFDPVFDRYGFEDRDLFIRLERSGARACHTAGARVLHEDRITLASVARKLCEAGLHSAPHFRSRHPDAYARMPYSRFDCELHPWLSAIDAACHRPMQRLLRGKTAWLEWRWLPFRLRTMLARLVSGLSYLHGTALRRARERRAGPG
jgi:glycosyltransferase involved in cell wall biosynthesis